MSVGAKVTTTCGVKCGGEHIFHNFQEQISIALGSYEQVILGQSIKL